MAQLNFLDPHLEAVFKFIGLADNSFVRVDSEEHKDERFKQAMVAAEYAMEDILDRIGSNLGNTQSETAERV